MSTNNLGATSQNHIFIRNLSEFDSLPNNTIIDFICEHCGKLSSKNIHVGKRRQKTRPLLCKGCFYKQTVQQKYGVDNVSQLQYIKLEKQKTCRKNYGVDNPSKSQEIQDIKKIHTFEKYGVNHTSQLELTKEKMKNTNLLKYGVENVFQSNAIKDKIKTTLLERYGVEYITQSSVIQDRIKKNNNEKYGVDYPIQNKEIMEKQIETNLMKYGVKYVSQSRMSRACRGNRKYYYNTEYFDSSWGLAFYIYFIDKGFEVCREPKSIQYVYNDKIHYYFPDFEVNGQFYEIKGNQFWNEDGTMCNPYDHTQDGLFEAKHQCGLMNNVIFLREPELKVYINYVASKYGHNWKSKFKVS